MKFRWTNHRKSLATAFKLLALIALLGTNFAALPALARDKLPVLIQFSIQDENGNFFYEGEIEFCTPDGECVFADIHPGFPGHFFLPRADLKAGEPYTVFVYDKQVKVLFEMRGWTFNPEDYNPGYNSYWELDQFLIFPHFKAHPDRQLTFHLDTTLNPEWQVVSGLGFADEEMDNLPDWPELMATIQSPFMAGGKFRSDESAAGGVTKVYPGIGLSTTWRSGYPRIVPERDSRVGFRELQASYNQNRYGTMGVYFPGRNSDVSFHRMVLSYGLGQMDQTMLNHWSLSLAVGVGGIYDGSNILRYNGRKYFMVGGGIKARYIHALYVTDNLKVGLDVQLEWIHYPGAEDDDYWYGSAPAAIFGFTVY